MRRRGPSFRFRMCELEQPGATDDVPVRFLGDSNL